MLGFVVGSNTNTVMHVDGHQTQPAAAALVRPDKTPTASSSLKLLQVQQNTGLHPTHHQLSMSAAQILAVVQPQRDRMDACLVFPSMPAVMRLNKLGTFSMAQLGQSKVLTYATLRVLNSCAGTSHVCRSACPCPAVLPAPALRSP